jgi:hypothetical protein
VGVPGGPDAEAAEEGEEVSRVEELDEEGQRIEDLGDQACLSRAAEDNVDPLVVPCLNNLSASCIALKVFIHHDIMTS